MLVKEQHARAVAFVYRSPDFPRVDDTPEDRVAIGARIRQAREAIGEDNASEFARKVGVTPTTVYRWETGGNVPDIFRLLSIARTCRVRMEWLVGGIEPEHREAFARWLATPTGLAAQATAGAVPFLEGLPLLGYDPSDAFYDLAFMAYVRGLTPSDAARVAKTTAAHDA